MKRTILCRNATTFARNGDIDEDAFRAFMQRFVDADVGVYIGTAGSGESHALSRDELFRLYSIGVEVCRGKVPVNANPPEQHTAKATLEQTLVAAKAGVDVVNIYGPAGWHGYKPTEQEQLDFFADVLSSVKHPVALNPNGVMGWVPKASLVADLCRRYSQIVAINFATEGDGYFLAVKDMLPAREIDLNVNMAGSAALLNMGASGILTAEATLIPKTFRRYLDHFEKGEIDAMNGEYRHCVRLGQFVRAWGPSNARWLKMAMRVLKLPGGEGGLRPPYRMPPDAELRKFAEGLLALGIPEIQEQARIAGLSLAA